MSEENVSKLRGRKQKSLEEEIAAQREKLRKLEERHKEQQRKERERNQKAVMELIKSEKLDTVPAEVWRDAMPKIKALLVVENDDQQQQDHIQQSASESANVVSQPQVAFSTNHQTTSP